jgi:hypothetical protein
MSEVEIWYRSQEYGNQRVEIFKYRSRDLALCRVTQLLVANPTADLDEAASGRFVLKVDTP